MSEAPAPARLTTRWQAISRDGRRALIVFFTAGFPSVPMALDTWRRACDAGADVLEIGVPFSDPIADGSTIQRASQAALEAGVTTAATLDLIGRAALPVPVVVMTYANPVLAYGPARFAAAARDAGVAGVLLTDVPAGVDPTLEQAVRDADLALIRLVAPTTTAARLPAAVAGGSGFVYLISRAGVTGVRESMPADLAAQVARVRAATPLPVAVGFGIGTPAQAAAAARVADGVVVGSAVVEAVAAGGPAAAAALVGALAGAVHEGRT